MRRAIAAVAALLAASGNAVTITVKYVVSQPVVFVIGKFDNGDGQRFASMTRLRIEARRRLAWRAPGGGITSRGGYAPPIVRVAGGVVLRERLARQLHLDSTLGTEWGIL
jgi:hypothetical protein